jgi:hypothetical protein
MIVLPTVQVLPQSSTGIDSRVTGKASVENSLTGYDTGVSSLSDLISSVINDGNVRFTSDINTGNLRFPTGIKVDRNRRGKMCVQHRDEVQKMPIFLILNRCVFNICNEPAKWVGTVRRKGGYG